jgi:hypothetical protein
MPTFIPRGSPLLLPPNSHVTLRTRTQQISFINGKIVATDSLDLDRRATNPLPLRPAPFL